MFKAKYSISSFIFIIPQEETLRKKLGILDFKDIFFRTMNELKGPFI